MNMLLILLLLYALQAVLTPILGIFIGNSYYVMLIISIIIAFIFSIISMPAGTKKEFFKHQLFHQMFCIFSVMLIVGDLVLILIMG